MHKTTVSVTLATRGQPSGGDASSKAMGAVFLPTVLDGIRGPIHFSVVKYEGTPSLMGMDILRDLKCVISFVPGDTFLESKVLQQRLPLVEHSSGHILLDVMNTTEQQKPNNTYTKARILRPRVHGLRHDLPRCAHGSSRMGADSPSTGSGEQPGHRNALVAGPLRNERVESDAGPDVARPTTSPGACHGTATASHLCCYYFCYRYF